MKNSYLKMKLRKRSSTPDQLIYLMIKVRSKNIYSERVMALKSMILGHYSFLSLLKIFILKPIRDK